MKSLITYFLTLCFISCGSIPHKADTLFKTHIKRQNKVLQSSRMPASSLETSFISRSLTEKLLFNGFMLYRLDGKLFASRNNKDYLLYENSLCFEHRLELEKLNFSQVYKISNEGNKVFIENEKKRFLIHPSFNYLCQNI